MIKEAQDEDEDQEIPDAFKPDPWLSLTAVWRFHPNHIDYICYHYELLLAGKWPEKKSGYIDSPLDGKSQIQAYAPYVGVIDLIAEFHWRIDQCGDDGVTFRSYKLDIMLRDEEAQDRAREQITSEIERKCKRVRDYIIGVSKSGLSRRRQSYDSFKLSWYDNYAERREKYRLPPTHSSPSQHK